MSAVFGGSAKKGDLVMFHIGSRGEYWVGIATGRENDVHIYIESETAVCHTGAKLTGAKLDLIDSDSAVHRVHILGVTASPLGVRTSHG